MMSSRPSYIERKFLTKLASCNETRHEAPAKHTPSPSFGLFNLSLTHPSVDRAAITLFTPHFISKKSFSRSLIFARNVFQLHTRFLVLFTTASCHSRFSDRETEKRSLQGVRDSCWASAILP